MSEREDHGFGEPAERFEVVPLGLTGEARHARPIEDFLGPKGEHEAFGLTFPVLVLNVGTNPVTMRAGVVYPIATMLPAVPRTIGPLPDEIVRLSIGRSMGSDIALDHRTASRRHASLVRRRGGRWSLVDEGSANGTFVQGMRLRPGEPVPVVGPVAVLRFGDVTMSFLESAAFGAFLASLNGTRLTGGDTTRALRASALSASAARQTLPAGARRSRVAQALLSRLQASPVVWRSYKVVLADALVQEISSLAALLAFVEENAERVLCVEADIGLGRSIILFSIEEQRPSPLPVAGGETIRELRPPPALVDGGEALVESGETLTDLRAASPDAHGKVLVVEDDPTFRRDVCEALEGSGLDPVGAGDGCDAIRYLRTTKHGVSAMVLDLGLPNLDGLELRSLMKADPRLASIPVIVVSGMPRLGTVVSGLDVAFAIEKPVAVEELVGRVRSCVAAGSNL